MANSRGRTRASSGRSRPWARGRDHCLRSLQSNLTVVQSVLANDMNHVGNWTIEMRMIKRLDRRSRDKELGRSKDQKIEGSTRAKSMQSK